MTGTAPTDAAQGRTPHWQCLMICWGTRYGVADINRIVAAVRRHSRPEPRFVLMTDRDRPGLDPAVHCVPHPEYWLQEKMRGPGCQAKLAMFERGAIPDDLPTIFVDLDTAILGDLAQALPLARNRRSLLILQSSILPFGAFARWLFRLTGGKRYARGNSSVTVFHPRECSPIAERFRQLEASHPDFGFKPMVADERFMSWAWQAHAHALPAWFAVKFPTEFMLPWRWLILLRSAMPWVRRRRARLCAVTFPGDTVKAEKLMELAEGDRLVDRKGRILIWSETALGVTRRRIIDYYAGRTAGQP